MYLYSLFVIVLKIHECWFCNIPPHNYSQYVDKIMKSRIIIFKLQVHSKIYKLKTKLFPIWSKHNLYVSSKSNDYQWKHLDIWHNLGSIWWNIHFLSFYTKKCQYQLQIKLKLIRDLHRPAETYRDLYNIVNIQISETCTILLIYKLIRIGPKTEAYLFFLTDSVLCSERNCNLFER